MVDQVSRTARPDRLCFEITETAAITHMEDTKQFITAMRKLGVRIALDDFGAGVSSFGYLKILPVDLLKIDGQVVCDILHDRLDHTAVCCFHDIATAMTQRNISQGSKGSQHGRKCASRSPCPRFIGMRQGNCGGIYPCSRLLRLPPATTAHRPLAHHGLRPLQASIVGCEVAQ